jgi:hypothetical protein
MRQVQSHAFDLDYHTYLYYRYYHSG